MKKRELIFDGEYEWTLRLYLLPTKQLSPRMVLFYTTKGAMADHVDYPYKDKLLRRLDR